MITIRNSNFADEAGRTLQLRGVNLSGATKVPTRPNGATHLAEGFFDHRTVSFVGRPFPLAEADEHFQRLKRWGLTFLRFLVTWEAVEHAGPGQYDQEYLDYLYQVVKKAGEYGFTLFIDPHEDVWSRFTGGDGAPGWTLEACGLEMRNFKETGAAIVHQTHGDPFPRMIWPNNNGKLAAATMWTLFFGGNDFAPNVKIEGESAQDYLQRHYIDSIKQIAARLKEFDHVIGYDSLNEPYPGYIGKNLGKAIAEIESGDLPTPLQAMALGDGIPQEVETWERRITGPRKLGTRIVNNARVRAWRDGVACPWRENGVWGLDANGSPVILKADYFQKVNGKAVDFTDDYLRPFAIRFINEIRKEDPKAMLFIESAPATEPAVWRPDDPPMVVNAAHWYDGPLLFLKTYFSFIGYDMRSDKLVIGPSAVQKSCNAQLQHYKDSTAKRIPGAPVLLGEIGIPYDLNGAKAYRSGNFSVQEKAMDRSMRALEANCLNFTLWNYTPDNSNERGDLWNGEDLSIFSRDQQSNPQDPDSGGRALRAVVRPYPMATAGVLLRQEFNYRNGKFEFEFEGDPAVTAPTEIFLPALHYANGCNVSVSDGTFEVKAAEQKLIYRPAKAEGKHWVRITK